MWAMWSRPVNCRPRRTRWTWTSLCRRWTHRWRVPVAHNWPRKRNKAMHRRGARWPGPITRTSRVWPYKISSAWAHRRRDSRNCCRPTLPCKRHRLIWMALAAPALAFKPSCGRQSEGACSRCCALAARPASITWPCGSCWRTDCQTCSRSVAWAVGTHTESAAPRARCVMS